jgi:hypothetical protein
MSIATICRSSSHTRPRIVVIAPNLYHVFLKPQASIQLQWNYPLMPMKPIDLSGGVSARRCIVRNPSNISSSFPANLRCLVSRLTFYWNENTM